jgi:curli biogenesis system outer membrane secretion channel CsgG
MAHDGTQVKHGLYIPSARESQAESVSGDRPDLLDRVCLGAALRRNQPFQPRRPANPKVAPLHCICVGAMMRSYQGVGWYVAAFIAATRILFNSSLGGSLMRRFIGVLLLCLGLCSSLAAQQKKRVAVMNFDYATVQSYVASIFGADQDVGKGVSDLLVDRLVKGGVYSVIERSALDKVLSEQNFSNSDRANPASAAKIGKILGVDAIIIGSITQFGRDDQNRTIGGGALGGLTGRFGIGGVQRRKAKAVVGISARVIDTSTAEILAVATGKGQSTRSGTSLVGAGGGGGNAGGGGYDMSSKNFADTLLGEAVAQAVDSVAQQLDQSASNLPVHVVAVSGLVADVSGNTLILNVGSSAGVQMGQTLNVQRKIRDIRDPATGKIIKTVVNTLGTVRITQVDALSSTGTFTGSGNPKVGDVVKSSQ